MTRGITWQRRLLSSVLAVSMVLSSTPTPALATVLDDVDEAAVEELDKSLSIENPDLAALEEESSESQDDADQKDVVEHDEDTTTIDAVTNKQNDGMEPGEILVAASDEEEAVPLVTDYATFVSLLKVLEGYANDYAAANGGDSNGLIINFIRTGVERFSTGTWSLVAGPENEEFTAYVAAQDEANGTRASDLKDLGEFVLPNGDMADFGHLFGTIDIAYYAKSQGMADSAVNERFDMGGWAGDVVDLMSVTQVLGIQGSTDDERAAFVSANYLGVDFEELKERDPRVLHSFEESDLYGDLDGYYVTSRVFEGRAVSEVIEEYFTSSLTNEQRADYFLKNRLGGMVTRAGIRSSLLSDYRDSTIISVLEASYGVDTEEDIRVACVYSFADYLFELAGDDDGTDPENPDQPDDPDDPDEPENPDNPYYSVFSSSETTLAPGVTQDIDYALTADKKQIVYYTSTIDVSRDDVQIFANYANNDPSKWEMARVEDQMRSAQAKHQNENYYPVLGVNADFYNMTSGEPSGVLMMEGVEFHRPGTENFFGIKKDGTPIIGGYSDYEALKDQLQEAVGASTFLIKDGKMVVSASANYVNSRASRTCVGLTADGKVVLMVLDGRQEPFSAGGAYVEIAQIMLDAGCVVAVNLDGGGSSTFVARQEGTDDYSVINKPSDGYARSVSSSLMVVSTTASTKEFDHALIGSEADYVTVGGSVNLTMTGVSSTGNAADLPADITWAVSDSAIGSISGDTFTAADEGPVEVQAVVNGVVVGSRTITVVDRNDLTLSFAKPSMDVVYGQTAELPLAATYNGNPVKILPSDIDFRLSNKSAGVFDGFSFKVAGEDCGLRNVRVTAYITSDYSIEASILLSFFSADEAYFDFDNAMYGDRLFAWNREVSNSTIQTKVDEGVRSDTYIVKDPEKPMVTDYTFAIDMASVPVPEQFIPLLKMIAGTDTLDDVRCWDILLMLAERVSKLTNVTVTIDVDPNMEANLDDVKIANDYFELTSTDYDREANKITFKLNFIKQSEAIDASTANPIVIVSGISFTPKDDAAWDASDRLEVAQRGTISYDIYLGASALYNMARQESFQREYGIYPYEEPDNHAHPNGGHFESTFMDFADSYVLDNAMRQGWYLINGHMYYFVDNKPLTGIHYVEGVYPEQDKKFYFEFDESGASLGKVTGLFELDGDYYYAVEGELMKGWRTTVDEDGNELIYHLDYGTGKAADGVYTTSGHTYTFKDHVLVKGSWETDENGVTHYWWAGRLIQYRWIYEDGKEYYANPGGGAIAKGLQKALNQERDASDWYLFDTETGEWLSDYNGLYTQMENGIEKTYLIKDGMRVAYPGLFELDGYYYYITSSYALVKNSKYTISKTNGLMPQGTYTFDSEGRLVVLDGIVKDGDVWTYYVDGAKTYAGLIKIGGDCYYVKSDCTVVHGKDYFVSKANGLMPQGTYTFDSEGKMVIYDGILKDGDTWTYFVNNAKVYAGLIEIDGDYYYVKSDCTVVHGRDYYVSKTNNLKPQGTYTFDADGKMQ